MRMRRISSPNPPSARAFFFNRFFRLLSPPSSSRLQEVMHIMYGLYSGMYVCFLSMERFRLHSKIDEEGKNLVTKSAVVKGVFLQQILHTIISVILFKITGSDADAARTQQFSILLLARQFKIAMLVLDTWQYFIHRYMHLNKFLYKHIHSQHHRLSVPYAYGALYNHPLGGLLLDTVGGAFSFLLCCNI